MEGVRSSVPGLPRVRSSMPQDPHHLPANSNQGTWAALGSPSQVGGRHQPFWNRWAEVTQDSWVLAIIREGYKLELVRQPLLSPIPLPFHLPADPEQVELVAQEIRSMLDKLAVEVVADHSPGFYSSIFLVRKKREVASRHKPASTQPVPSGSTLQDGVDQVSDERRPGRRLVGVNRPVRRILPHPNPRGFQEVPTLRVPGAGVPIQALPFGLATSPRVFTRVVACVAAACHQMG